MSRHTHAAAGSIRLWDLSTAGTTAGTRSAIRTRGAGRTRSCPRPSAVWDLLKTIYPLSKPGAALYIHGCDTDHPVGYHTGTPMGNIDALPIESDVKLLENYGALAFMGYHCADESDYEKLTEYVSRGGKLMLTRAHMS